MAHVYNNFPGPVDVNGRPLGVCNCGRWADSTDELTTCPNAGPQGKIYCNNLYLL